MWCGIRVWGPEEGGTEQWEVWGTEILQALQQGPDIRKSASGYQGLVIVLGRERLLRAGQDTVI